ncbi:MAG: acyl-CoA thioesterase [Planctomycetales bacterium]|nr:acyl-CoA thioesterase [Planctomycetales bacterium]
MTHDELLADYPSRISLPIQWGDMDAFNHVNNVVYIRWFESSRIAYLETAGMRELLTAHGLGPILAAINCSYKRQLVFPGSVTIGARVSNVGRTSLTVSHRVVDDQSVALAAEGESVIVVFDFDNQRPVRMPEDVKEAVGRFQCESVKS